MTKDKNISNQHLIYLKKRKKEKVLIYLLRATVLTAILCLWELFARVGIIDSFITSYPSEIAVTIFKLFKELIP